MLPVAGSWRKLFRLQEGLSPWRDFTLDMSEFLRVRNGTNGPNLPGLHFNGEHEKGVRTCANNQGRLAIDFCQLYLNVFW